MEKKHRTNWTNMISEKKCPKPKQNEKTCKICKLRFCAGIFLAFVICIFFLQCVLHLHFFLFDLHIFFALRGGFFQDCRSLERAHKAPAQMSKQTLKPRGADHLPPKTGRRAGPSHAQDHGKNKKLNRSQTNPQ